WSRCDRLPWSALWSTQEIVQVSFPEQRRAYAGSSAGRWRSPRASFVHECKPLGRLSACCASCLESIRMPKCVMAGGTALEFESPHDAHRAELGIRQDRIVHNDAISFLRTTGEVV